MSSINYDFIIVGGGASGSALAASLASKGPTLLIERGVHHEQYPQSKVPQGWPQIAALTLEQNQFSDSNVFTGTPRVLGGGTTLNAGVCWRPERRVFDAAGVLTSKVEKAFEYLEDKICKPSVMSNFTDIFANAWTSYGLLRIDDSISGQGGWMDLPEATRAQGTVQRARSIFQKKDPNDEFLSRTTSAALFDDSLANGNLDLLLMSSVKKVIFNARNEAIGVQVYSSLYGHFSVYVRKGGKVFLTAGAHETPKLLMLSGIGPKAVLDEFEIPHVFTNDAVGQNLIERRQVSVMLPSLKDIEGGDDAMLSYGASKEHYFSSFVRKDVAEWANAFTGCPLCEHDNRANAKKCQDQLLAGMLLYGIGSNNDNIFYGYYILPKHPKARGYVTLSTSDFNDLPKVYDGWHEDIEQLSSDALSDLDMLADAVQDLIGNVLRKTSLLEDLGHPYSNRSGDFSNETIKALGESLQMFQAIGKQASECHFALPTLCTSWNDCVPTLPSVPTDPEKLKQTVFRNSISAYHSLGTCRVGDVVEKGDFSVKGVNGLYIADLSVIPEHVDIHPQMTAMTMGVIVGDSTDALSFSQYEIFPVVFAIFSCCLVLITIVWYLFEIEILDVGIFRKKSELNNSARPNLSNANTSLNQSLSAFWSHPNSRVSLRRSLSTFWSQKSSKRLPSFEVPAHSLDEESNHDTNNDIVNANACKQENPVDENGINNHVIVHHDNAYEQQGNQVDKKKSGVSFLVAGNIDIVNDNACKQENLVDENGINNHVIVHHDNAHEEQENQVDKKKRRVYFHDGTLQNKKVVNSEEVNKALMQWKNVSCSYDRKDGSNPVTTLFNNFGTLNEGEVTAIMGPSGAAKSTLLDILTGRKSIGSIKGTVSVLGHEYEAENGLDDLNAAIRNVSAYIPQSEYFFPTQTCVEAVAFAANMKFGRDRDGNRVHFLHACLDAVGLPHKIYACRKIGGTLNSGFTVRGLSGGERKRLALATALVLKPKLLFMDELTSGLDSHTTVQVMLRLKSLSMKQKVASMIIIHQPSPEVFVTFDQLVLLAKGRCVYSGKCSMLSTFYEVNFDESIPIDKNIAEDLIEKAIHTQTEQTELKYVGQKHESLCTTTVYEMDHSSKMQTATVGWKLITIFRRNLLNHYLRNVGNAPLRMICYGGLSLVIGVIFWSAGKGSTPNGLTFEESQSLVGAIAFLLNVSYLLPFAVISLFVGDKKFFVAETAVGLYSSWMYCLVQAYLEFVLLSLTAIVSTIIVVPMCALWNPSSPQWASFFTVMSVLIAAGLVGSSVVLCMSMLLPSQDAVFLVGASIACLWLALCGAFVPPSQMTPTPYGLQWISAAKYSFQGMMISQLEGTSSEVFLELNGYNEPASVSGNIGILIGFWLAFAIISSIALSRLRTVC